MRPLLNAAVITLTTLAAPAWALDQILDFSGNICGAAGNGVCNNYDQIGQNYGDVAGQLDVSHRSILSSNGVLYESYLKYWSTGYSNLTSIAWGGGGPAGYRSEISFTPGAGQMVTLNSFDFGDYQNRNYGSTVQIYDSAGALLWDGGAFNPGVTANSFAPGISNAGTLVLRWGPDGYDVGIDNISVSVSAVPEPASWALLLIGLSTVGAAARRRRGI